MLPGEGNRETMDCQDQFAPGAKELVLLVFGEGELAPEVVRHLHACMICQQRLRQFRQLYLYLLAKLYRSQCPDGLHISLYCADLLEKQEKEQIEAHLRECPLCAEEVAISRRFMADPLLPVAPASPFHDLVPMRGGRQTRLILHHRPRSARWPRLYRSKECELVLSLSYAAPGCCALYGLLSRLGPALNDRLPLEGVQVELLPLETGERKRGVASSGLLLTTTVDRDGRLLFPAVSPGRYTLLLHLPVGDLVIEDLQIDV